MARQETTCLCCSELGPKQLGAGGGGSAVEGHVDDGRDAPRSSCLGGCFQTCIQHTGWMTI